MTDFIIKRDNHTEDSTLLFEKANSIEKRGVIHVGAHLGEEYKIYKELGFEHIVFIEANPNLCAMMEKKFSKHKDVKVINCIISDKNEVLDFYIHQSNTGVESSSILKMDKFDKVVTSLHTSKVLRVQSYTLKQLFEKEALSIADYNVLVTDVQGADFLVLKGAGDILGQLDIVISEVQCVPLYEDYVSESKIEAYLKQYSLHKTFTIYHELYEGDKTYPAWGETLFIKKTTMQRWKKAGVIYNSSNYSAVPVLGYKKGSVLSIFLSTRDAENRSLPFIINYDVKQRKVLEERTLDIPLGRTGCFDENGIMPTSIIQKGDSTYMYYIGWNLAKSTPFRNAIGLAISNDGGNTFHKYSEGPILDRGIHDHCFVASCCVFPEENFYRMYYLSCHKWEYDENGNLTHSYNIKYAESKDGIHWERSGKVAIDFRFENEYAISVPRVIKENGIYKMWYSFRASSHAATYRIGYAESMNGVDWVRKDEEVGLDVSESGWDSEMICYPYIFDHAGKRYMLYNGNGYGKTGFGLAVLEND